MSNDGTSYKPWKVRKGLYKSTGTSDYALPPRDTPSPIIEMPMSPAPAPKSTCSPLSPSSPRVMIIESPLSPSMIQRNISNVREIPIERFDEVSVEVKLEAENFPRPPFWLFHLRETQDEACPREHMKALGG